MEREQLIEKFGIEGANLIQTLQNQIEELHEYLGVVRLAQVSGFKLRKNPALEQ